ncbi:hypothetical protein RFI_11443, partial [Reticulomyxa filosa]
EKGDSLLIHMKTKLSNWLIEEKMNEEIQVYMEGEKQVGMKRKKVNMEEEQLNMKKNQLNQFDYIANNILLYYYYYLFVLFIKIYNKNDKTWEQTKKHDNEYHDYVHTHSSKKIKLCKQDYNQMKIIKNGLVIIISINEYNDNSKRDNLPDVENSLKNLKVYLEVNSTIK